MVYLGRLIPFRENVRRIVDGIAGWIAWKLPRRVVYWAAIRVAAHATTGKFGSEEAPSVTIVTMLKRWDEKN